jgi:uncharacterized membrane protein
MLLLVVVVCLFSCFVSVAIITFFLLLLFIGVKSVQIVGVFVLSSYIYALEYFNSEHKFKNSQTTYNFICILS